MEFGRFCELIERLAADLGIDALEVASRMQQMVASENLRPSMPARRLSEVAVKKSKQDNFVPIFVAVAAGIRLKDV